MFGRDDAKHEAFDAVVEAYQGKLLRYATRMMRDEASAEDAVQNTFIKCAAHWRDAMEPSSQLSAWLYRVVHNEALDMKRRDKRRWFLHKKHAQELADEGMAMHTSLVQISETAEAAAIALETLSDRERQIVVLKVYEDMSYKEIAEITELSTGNVGFVLHRAMEKLAKELTKQFARRKGGGL